MHAKKLIVERDFDLSTLSPSSLDDLYDRTVEGLRICSQLSPSDTSDDQEMDQKEIELLEFESSLLEYASRIPLKSKEDVNILIEIWAKASGIHEDSYVRQSDKIVMNIFRHLSGRLGQA